MVHDIAGEFLDDHLRIVDAAAVDTGGMQVRLDPGQHLRQPIATAGHVEHHRPRRRHGLRPAIVREHGDVVRLRHAGRERMPRDQHAVAGFGGAARGAQRGLLAFLAEGQVVAIEGLGHAIGPCQQQVARLQSEHGLPAALQKATAAS